MKRRKQLTTEVVAGAAALAVTTETNENVVNPGQFETDTVAPDVQVV